MTSGAGTRLFEELDYSITPIGALSLCRRRDPARGLDVFEVRLGSESLMTSLFTASEIALGELGVAACHGATREGAALEIVVGGLGLGYTAQAALAHAGVADLLVVEYLAPVIQWHRQGILPMGTTLAGSPRCRLIEADFFALAASEAGFDPLRAGRRFDAVLVDIDHSPEALLDPRSDSFYSPDGLRALARHLKPDGIFGLWSNDPPDPRFLERLRAVFAQAWAEPVSFRNPVNDHVFTQSVYLARHDEAAAG